MVARMKIKIKKKSIDKIEAVPDVPNVPEIEGNTKTSISTAIKWCFTFNNYTDSDLEILQTQIPHECRYAIFGKEVGEHGTPHLQGYIEFNTKHRPLEIFKFKSIHWEKALGTKSQNVAYCSKGGDIWSFPATIPIKTIDSNNFYEWEREIIDKINEPPDDRTINWYFGTEGGEGKTSFCKYLAVKKNALVLGGKASDIRNAICDYAKSKGNTPELIVVNIPRSFDAGFISYEGYENIKDMLFYSGKYEGGMVVGNPPHLFIFANVPPKLDKMSQDRWYVRQIGDNGVAKGYSNETPLDEI